jgi:hypothetical protein
MSATYKVRVYTCKKHPLWSLESRTPVIESTLKVFCPLCRDEWMAKAIGVADCRVETREAKGNE